MTRIIIPYIGGKFYHARWICQYLDYRKDTYIELFFGGGSILWAKKHHKIEIVNDINAELMNMYLMIRDRFDEFVEVAQFYQYDENMFRKLRDEIKNEKDDLKRAVYFFLLSNMTFSGKTNWSSFSYALTNNTSQTLWNKIKNIKWFHFRLKNVQVVNKDFRDLLNTVLENKNSKRVCIYADPPYIDREFWYKGDFKQKDHEDLAELLNKIHSFGGFVAISYYDNPILEKLYPKSKFLHLKKEVSKHSYYKQGLEEKPSGIETLIISKQ